MNIVMQGDMLEVLKDIPDDTFDLSIMSPPYEDARLYGDLNYKVKGQEWVDWAVERYVECVRVTKGLVVWVVEGRTRQFRWSATPALMMADLHRAGVKLRKPPIYHRVGIPGSGGPDWWRNDYEFCIAASKGRLPWSDNTASGEPPKYGPGGKPSHRKQNGQRVNQGEPTVEDGKNWGRHRLRRHSYEYVPPERANPGNVLKIPVGGAHMGSPLAHENEAPFPEALIEPYVKCFCPPDGIVFDGFCGSGTTLAVAIKNGRQYFGVDVREDQIALSERRIEEAMALTEKELVAAT